ncbi:hypothetical protein ACJ41O_015287 [Fusarium nematophilum]
MALSEKSPLVVDQVNNKLPMNPPEYDHIGIQRGSSAHPWGMATHALASVLRSARAAKRADVRVSLANHFSSKVYTTNSEVSGEVVITPARDIPFDHLDIALVGSADTRRDGVDMTHLTTHRFLRLEMPVDEDAYPAEMVFQAGRTYTFPFNFNIPAHLSSQACTHRISSDDLWERHMSLPPTLGGWEKDDLAPDMARIEYSVKAHILTRSRRGLVVVADSSHPVNVMPTTFEEPPLSITENDRLYSLQKSKNVRKNLFSSVQGRISAVAAQPAAVHLSREGHDANQSSIPVTLTFEPSSADVVPPQLNSAAIKVGAHTWFREAPMQVLPNLGNQMENFAYPESVSLPKTCKPTVEWTQHVDPSNQKSPIFHTATVEVPFKLPVADKMFVPTFHSCIISRVYSLRLVLDGDVKLELTAPLQVVMDPSE